MVNVRFSSHDELNAIVDDADRLPSYSNHILNSENISSLRNCLRNVEVFHAYEENTSVDKFVTLTIFKAKRDDDFEYFDIYVKTNMTDKPNQIHTIVLRESLEEIVNASLRYFLFNETEEVDIIEF